MTAFDQITFLADSPSRLAVLETLQAGPRERNELQEAVGVSRSTINRILEGLSERGWIVRDRRQYRITSSGRNVAAQFTTLLETIESDSRLTEVIDWLPTELPDFETRMFADATITMADPSAPYRPMERLMKLGEDTATSHTRSFGTRPLPGYFERWELEEGINAEVIFSPLVVEALQQSPPDGTAELLASGTLSFRVHENLPCGLTLYDEHIALCGYDQTTGMLEAVVDTDDSAALEWANAVYESYRSESEPVDQSVFAIEDTD